MERQPCPEQPEEKQKLKKKGRRALVINVVFFVILFAGMLLVPFSGFHVAAIVIAVAFVASLLYIYMF